MKPLLKNFCEQPENRITQLTEIIAVLRPDNSSDREKANNNLEQLISILEEDIELKNEFSRELANFIGNLNTRQILTENGILPPSAFQKELKNRIGRRILPPLLEKQSMEYVFDKLFTQRNDGQWLQGIDESLFYKLIELFWSNANVETKELLDIQLIASLEIITNRICNLGHDPQVIAMVPDFNNLQSPFFQLNDFTDEIIKHKKNKHSHTIEHVFDKIRHLHRQIDLFIAMARRNRSKYGITLGITYKLQRMQQLNKRLILLINCLDKRVDYKEPVSHLFKELVMWHSRRYSLSQIINDNLGVLAHQITEHNSKSGERYITSSRSEYWELFRSACGAGLVVGFLVVFKTLIYYLHASPFLTTLLYSLNYAVGFVAIYLWKFTLATKQPAMTASTLSHALQTAQKGGDFSKFANLVAKVSRSQTIAFTGNVIVAFPVSYCVSALFYYLVGHHIMDLDKAIHSVHDQNPFISLALVHAAIAGFYLFLSGIIAGYTENLSVYYKIPERIERQPLLKRNFSKEKLKKMSHFFRVHAGPISGNISLGFFLGSTFVIGKFLGLNIDIRHITFSAGTFGVALAGLDNILSLADWIFTFIGIFLIGGFNFLISFAMSMFVALRSRNISITKLPEVVAAIGKIWRKNKRQFFVPVKEERV
ncbi:MAG: site-specific recombinase [Bacteroidia bacterium]